MRYGTGRRDIANHDTSTAYNSILALHSQTISRAAAFRTSTSLIGIRDISVVVVACIASQ